MAMDIVPIQLSLTAGDLITLWAPRWREDGEEWEGFLGDEDAVHAFPDAAALAGYVRTVPEHDLNDHPAWPLLLQLTVGELVPEEDQCYDLIGVPEIVADEPDTWTVSELASITTLVRSLADTCELTVVHDVLNAAEGFALLERGTWAFNGREGGKLWEQLADTIANRWDEVVDALDAVVVVPEVNQAALDAARRELAAQTGEPAASDAGAKDSAAEGEETDGETASGDSAADDSGASDSEAPAEAAEDSPPLSEAAAFWESVGIDPILISADDAEHYTLRCYLNDKPVFLGRAGRIDALPSARALARYLAESGADGHDLTAASTWAEVVAKATAGELEVEVDPQNTYQLAGLTEDLTDGPTTVDPSQLDLGVELLLDVGEWAGDESAALALRPSQSLGWLTSFVLRPDPTRLAPSPPFDAEAQRWAALADDLLRRLRRP
ncbi:MAG TPA: primosomal protein [Pseudonocardia sp.]|uniref:primosomal protein n=1 Tax=Pseudonocardia sp. TaxID=60912 RepID=UPI002CFD55A8|nr:primosomal protein [Pseudonocardia sp.]HTF49187.1 primosomal protein [Pseudonocardia sp.]